MGIEYMRKERLQSMSNARLFAKYVEIGLAQGDAMRDDEPTTYNQLYAKMRAIEEELKTRPGDERHALMPLHHHPEAQLRLNSARATLAIAPQASRLALEELARSKAFPQAGDAGMSLSNLDEGIYKPT